MPTSLRVDWIDGDTFRLHDVRVPANGSLDPASSPLAKVRIEVAGDAQGKRRAVVRGLVDTGIVSEGTAEIDVAPGTWTPLPISLLPGRRPDRDGDGVPDDVDGCPDDKTTFGPCPGAADAGAPDVLAPDDSGAPDESVPVDATMDEAVAIEAGIDVPVDLVVPLDAPGDVPVPDTGPPPQFACGAVILVVGSTNVAGDKQITARLTQMGCAVAIIDDSTVAATDAAGKSLVIISETAVAARVASKLKTITAGLIQMQPNLLDDYSFTGHTQATDWDVGAMEQTVTVMAPPMQPALAGKLAGTLPLFDASVPVGWGTPDQAAIKVAAFPATPTRFFEFAFDTGAMMSGGSKATGRRLAFLVSRDAVIKLNAYGWTLFDAAVAWTSGH